MQTITPCQSHTPSKSKPIKRKTIITIAWQGVDNNWETVIKKQRQKRWLPLQQGTGNAGAATSTNILDISSISHLTWMDNNKFWWTINRIKYIKPCTALSLCANHDIKMNKYDQLYTHKYMVFYNIK